MRYLFALCILAWAGCSTNPVLEIEELERERELENTVIIDPPGNTVKYILFSTANGRVYLNKIGENSSKQISPSQANVLDFVLTPNREEVKMLIDSAPFDSVLVYNIGLQNFTLRSRVQGTGYDGICVEPNADIHLFDRYPPAITRFSNYNDANLSGSTYNELNEVIFFTNKRCALIAENGAGHKFEILDIDNGPVDIKGFFSEVHSLDIMPDNSSAFFMVRNTPTDQDSYTYDISSRSLNSFNLRIGSRMVIDLEFHPVDEEVLYLLVHDVYDDRYIELIRYNMVTDYYSTVANFSQLVSPVEKFQVR